MDHHYIRYCQSGKKQAPANIMPLVIFKETEYDENQARMKFFYTSAHNKLDTDGAQPNGKWNRSRSLRRKTQGHPATLCKSHLDDYREKTPQGTTDDTPNSRVYARPGGGVNVRIQAQRFINSPIICLILEHIIMPQKKGYNTLLSWHLNCSYSIYMRCY